MGSTSAGDEFELVIYKLLKTEIAAGRFFVKKSLCKIFHKKGYYSKDRESEIIFDISIEVYMPGASEYSMLILVECKNYTHSVPVDDAEEFFIKVQQVAAANAKAIIASPASYQKGARAFAKSKGMGLIRYFDSSNFKWELLRSPSCGIWGADDRQDEIELDAGLSQDNFSSKFFDLYLQSPVRSTNSLWDFVGDFVIQIPADLVERKKLANSKKNLGVQVPFQGKDRIEAHAARALNEIGHTKGEVSLEDLCSFEKERSGLVVKIGADAVENGHLGNPILGSISFSPLEITIFNHARLNKGRERFTLAHELAHHMLGHSKFMAGEVCDEFDFSLTRKGIVERLDISRMEFQANYFAASLLMPRESFTENFRRILLDMNISDRGYGALYVDDQPCNRQNYEFVMNRLMSIYGVSRSAAAIRLEGLGLFRDARSERIPPAIGGVISSIFSK